MTSGAMRRYSVSCDYVMSIRESVLVDQCRTYEEFKRYHRAADDRPLFDVDGWRQSTHEHLEWAYSSTC